MTKLARDALLPWLVLAACALGAFLLGAGMVRPAHSQEPLYKIVAAVQLASGNSVRFQSEQVYASEAACKADLPAMVVDIVEQVEDHDEEIVEGSIGCIPLSDLKPEDQGERS